MEAIRLQSSDPEKRAVTRALRTALISSVALAAILMSLLTVASGNNDLLQRHYGTLLWLNVGIAIALAVLAVEMARRLYIRYRKGMFGTRLMARLAVSFMLMTAVPVILIYTVAVQFLGRSIESWFDVPMERALDSGLRLGRITLDSLLADLSAKARRAADELAQESDDADWPERLTQLRDQYGVQEAVVMTGGGSVLMTSGSRFSQLLPDMPTAAALSQARLARRYAAVETIDSLERARSLNDDPGDDTADGLDGQSAGPDEHAVGGNGAGGNGAGGNGVGGNGVGGNGVGGNGASDKGAAARAAASNDAASSRAAAATSTSEAARPKTGADASEKGDAPDARRGNRGTLAREDDAGDVAWGLKLRALSVIPALRPGPEVRLLQFVHPVPEALASNAEAVQGGFRDYQQLSLSRIGLKRIFKVTLTVTVLLTIFSAIAAAFLLAGWLTGPLSMLAAGTRAVAEGDFRPVKDYVGRDELGMLTQSFNAMTRQLLDARSQVERNRVELELANARLASVLSNLTAGVLVLDERFRISLANAGAERILGESADQLCGADMSAIARLQPMVLAIGEAYDEVGVEGPQQWQRQVTLDSDETDNANRGFGKTLLLRGARLPNAESDRLVVFDDITDVISAQRATAWSEVARRLAHEIKNPLTPIQLAAERTALKLSDKLLPTERDLLQRNMRTIVNQVGALKLMVDEFRDYARLPTARPVPLDLNELVSEVLSLYQYNDAERRLRVGLTPGLPKILGDPGQLRQVMHNLLKNAGEAIEKQAVRLVEVYTDAVHNVAGQTVSVRLIVRDNGPGFNPALLPRVFEPYVSNKPKGTGLGLAIVRKIIQDHGGRIEVGNRPEPFPMPEMASSGHGLPHFIEGFPAQPGGFALKTAPAARTPPLNHELSISEQLAAQSLQKAASTSNPTHDTDPVITSGGGAWIHVVFAKLAKSDENFSAPATRTS